MSPSSPEAARQRYWKSTRKWVAGLLAVWFLCSLGAGVIWADPLDAAGQAFCGGMGWGFWFSQQGSIVIFLVLLAIFVAVMNRLDARLAREISATKGGEE